MKDFKIDIENSANDLYEKAQSLETMFLKYRLELSRNAPDQLLKEVYYRFYFIGFRWATNKINYQKEIECLKAELKRKEDLLNDTKEKIALCENDLRLILKK